jgi:alcohol dehydrogenase (NADP+)
VFPEEPSDYIPLEQLPIIETWKQMEKTKEQGLAHHIGVSNFSKSKLQDLISKATLKPEMNQIEMHPLLQQNELLDYCKSEGIIVTGYSPLGSGDRSGVLKVEGEPNLLELQLIKEIALKHHITTSQVLLAWQCEKGIAVIPKSTNMKHIISNFAAGNIPLDEDDMIHIASLDRHFRYFNGKFFEMPGSGYSNIYDD